MTCFCFAPELIELGKIALAVGELSGACCKSFHQFVLEILK